MNKIKTVYDLEKELENIKVLKKKKQNSLSYNICCMIMIGTDLCISLILKYLAINSLILDINAVNIFVNLSTIGAISLEMFLGFRTKKLSNDIDVLNIDIREKKIKIDKQKNEDMKKAIEIVDKALERKGRSSTYRDDFSSFLDAGPLIKEMTDGNPVNINPLQDIPESEIKFYALIGKMGYRFFSSKEELDKYILENNIEMQLAYEIEYLRHLAGHNDVLSLRRPESSKPKYYTAIDNEVYAEYNAKKSTYKGEFVWEYYYGPYLEPIYKELKNRGINLERDVCENIVKLLKK